MKYRFPEPKPPPPLAGRFDRRYQAPLPDERSRRQAQLLFEVIARLKHEEDEWLWAQFTQRLPHWRRHAFLFIWLRVRRWRRRLADWQPAGSRLPRARTWGLVHLNTLIGWAHTQFSVVRVVGELRRPQRIAVDVRGLRYWRGQEDRPQKVTTEPTPC